ncbi:uncharacterized protein AKAW2_40434S [Aspergillus luchuensis]|uniref:Uncharacterized protein n=1 Tax=Aspergillus kawachii TaxID=1069201 RepID=A0A7R7ZZ22_ASPKA|nr:uncharacterized protein AKAW2_40434S [Aspergillus luchuensis]BCR98751.1 hypothetical protein AKAW2_40434S [Aspergillus luchuensis]BCS11074.1 hypothetical protein ALUC_40414S [Aspergillus luchuensis]
MVIEKLFLSSARSWQTAKGPRGNNSDWPNWCAVSAHAHLCRRYDECDKYKQNEKKDTKLRKRSCLSTGTQAQKRAIRRSVLCPEEVSLVKICRRNPSPPTAPSGGPATPCSSE